MGIFNKGGNPIYSAYDMSGYAIETAYSVDGEIVFPDIDPEDYNLVVMSFNNQSWTGLSAWEYMGPVIQEYAPDIVGTQESHTSNNMTNLGYSAEVSPTQSSNIVFSKHTMTNATGKSYDVDHYAGKRGYQKMYFTFNGKNICMVNTHLDPSTNWQYDQAEELFNLVKNEEYFILTADLNTICQNADSPSYINVIKQFADAGLNVCNCSDRFGFIGSYSSGTDEYGSFWANDNIILSENITVAAFIVDRTKVYLGTGLKIDHLPLIAYLKIV